MSLLTIFLSSLYPRRLSCDLCGRDARLDTQGPGAYLCPDCLGKLQRAEQEIPPDGLDGLYAGLLYNDAAATLIRRFKYHHGQYLAQTLACFLPEIPAVDCIVPVPLHPARQKQRGYNQSLLLAGELAQREGLPLEPALLIRRRDTANQASLSADERPGNVQGAFRAHGQVRSRRILLVDDVVTTGATLCACAEALRAKGAAGVWAATVCSAHKW